MDNDTTQNDNDTEVREDPRATRYRELRGTVHAVPEVLASEHSPDAYNRLARTVNLLLEASGLLYVAPTDEPESLPA
jgi:hypothetical protein